MCTNYQQQPCVPCRRPRRAALPCESLGEDQFDQLAQYAPTARPLKGGVPSVMGVHLVSEAERLAYADRDKYVADTDFDSRYRPRRCSAPTTFSNGRP